ncbi:MAG: TolC family protein [Elusimicrobia bacterium]|nr:TolC family protein [Elusimicrobiota bacterium]
MSLASVLELAQKDNPEIQAARHAWAAAANVPEEARAFDDPTLNVSHMLTGMRKAPQTMAGPMGDQITITQNIPFWGKRALRGQAASMAAEVSRQALRAKSLEIMDRTVRAYYGIYFLDQAIAILEEQQSVMNRFSRSATEKYTVGRAPESEALRAQVELAKIENDLVTAEEKQKSARARLNALLDRSPEAPLGRLERPENPDFRWNETAWSEQALAMRPEILALRALKNKNAAERRLAIRDYFPDLTLGYQYSEIGGGTTNLPYDGQDAQALSFGLNLPIWLNKENAALRQSRENLAASESGLQDMVNETRYQVENLSVKADTAARLFKLYEDTVLPQAQAALDSTQNAYEAGRASFLSLLDSERSLLSFELDQERHRVDFEIAVADLERVSGGPLTAQGGKQ